MSATVEYDELGTRDSTLILRSQPGLDYRIALASIGVGAWIWRRRRSGAEPIARLVPLILGGSGGDEDLALQ